MNSNTLKSELSVIHPIKQPPLTHIMFHIGENLPFDRLLHDYDSISWEHMFEIPMSISKELLTKQVLSRVELVNILKLPRREREAANFIKQLCTTGSIVRR